MRCFSLIAGILFCSQGIMYLNLALERKSIDGFVLGAISIVVGICLIAFG